MIPVSASAVRALCQTVYWLNFPFIHGININKRNGGVLGPLWIQVMEISFGALTLHAGYGSEANQAATYRPILYISPYSAYFAHNQHIVDE